jgi:hypothetical protein
MPNFVTCNKVWRMNINIAHDFTLYFWNTVPLAGIRTGKVK